MLRLFAIMQQVFFLNYTPQTCFTFNLGFQTPGKKQLNCQWADNLRLYWMFLIESMQLQVRTGLPYRVGALASWTEVL